MPNDTVSLPQDLILQLTTVRTPVFTYLVIVTFEVFTSILLFCRPMKVTSIHTIMCRISHLTCSYL